MVAADSIVSVICKEVGKKASLGLYEYRVSPELQLLIPNLIERVCTGLVRQNLNVYTTVGDDGLDRIMVFVEEVHAPKNKIHFIEDGQTGLDI